MSERKYRIYELTQWASPATDPSLTVTESELKRRLAHIAPMDLKFQDGTECVHEEDIYYLLHGEKMPR